MDSLDVPLSRENETALCTPLNLQQSLAQIAEKRLKLDRLRGCNSNYDLLATI